MKSTVLLVVLFILCQFVGAKIKKSERKKLPKDPLYITDLDLENLYDEWEESDDEILPPDELPIHKRPSAKIPLPNNGATDDIFKDPEKLMRASKKGKTVMAFVTVANKPTKEETELLTQRWQVGLTNNHMKCERFVVADDRAIFVFEDGSLAFEAKDYLIDQPELKDYSIDNRVWQGKGYPVEKVCPSGVVLVTTDPMDAEYFTDNMEKYEREYLEVSYSGEWGTYFSTVIKSSLTRLSTKLLVKQKDDKILPDVKPLMNSNLEMMLLKRNYK